MLSVQLTLFGQLEDRKTNFYASIGYSNKISGSFQIGYGGINVGPFGFGLISLNSGIEVLDFKELSNIFWKLGMTNSYNHVNVGIYHKNNFTDQLTVSPSLGLSYYGLADLTYERNFLIGNRDGGMEKHNVVLSFRICSGIINKRKKDVDEGYLDHWWW